MSTSFARDYHMHAEIAATREGKILALKVNVLADHGAFNNTAQPTKFPAGFFHIFTGSYDYPAAHCTVKGVYTNKAPGGVAYACSFRITEAAYVVERIVDCLAYELDMDPAELRMKNLLRAGTVPVHVADRMGVRLGRLPAHPADGDGHRRLRRATPRAGREARARRTDGHRRQLLHRGRRRRPAQAHGHSRARAWPTVRRCASTRPAKQSYGCRSRSQGQGHETTFAQIVSRGHRDPVRRHRRGAWGHRQHPVRAGHVRQPFDAGLGCCGGRRCEAGGRQGEDHRRGDDGGLAGRHRGRQRDVLDQGRSRRCPRRSRK